MVFQNGEWCIKNDLDEINDILSNIKPLDFFERLPRSLLELENYKASEFYNWLFYYSIPLLYEYLPEKYFQHWLLLVIASYNLLKDEISIF